MDLFPFALFTALIMSAVIFLGPTFGEQYSYLVWNGKRIEYLRCGTAGSSPHRWKAFRVEGNNLGPPIDIASFRNADDSLSFIVNTSTNTGYYYCVDAVDKNEIYDKYVILTDADRLQVFPSPVLMVNSTGTATFTIRFTQFEGTPEQPKTFYVNFLPDGAPERLGFRPILQSEIEDGIASFTVNATENGSISAEAEFQVGLVPRRHRVASNTVRLIYQNSLVVIIGDNLEEGKSGNPPGLSSGVVAVIVCGVLVATALVVGLLCVATNLMAYFGLRRPPERERLDEVDNNSVFTAVEEENGLDDLTANADTP